MVRWLHISDLHIVEKADWLSFEKELIKKCQEYDKIDLVIVTGDFHNFSDYDDFHLAAEFLRRLLKSLELDMEKDLFVVPGNHDGVNSVQEKEIFIRAAKSEPFHDTEQWMERLLEAFQDYETFVKDLIPHYPAEHPASVHSRTWRDRINFIHCNTALAADGKEKTDQLLDVDALAAMAYIPNLPNIILAHNSFFDLHQAHQLRVQDAIRVNSICAYFCGDRHTQSVDGISMGGGQVPCVVSYKGAPDPKDNYSVFGIVLGEWEKDLAELQGWCWRSGQGFSEDRKITGKRIPMRTEQITPVVVSPEELAVVEYTQEIDAGGITPNTRTHEYTLKRRFVTDYYHLTHQQIMLFNQRHKEMPLYLGMNGVELSNYVKEAFEKGVLAGLTEDLSLTLTSG